METAEFYEGDLLFYFRGHPRELELYQVLMERLAPLLPDLRVQVQKSQISFYDGHLLGAASLPVRRKKEWPRECLLVTFGLGTRCPSPRIAVATEPYPGRWTHHVVVSQPEQIDGELLDWLVQAAEFARSKGGRKR